ncbi:hypothetical protein J6590_015532 [Homalodisca vitripennis]|nr:hypothetical protein J6590_015532 [Homalodisca vitripennis]
MFAWKLNVSIFQQPVYMKYRFQRTIADTLMLLFFSPQFGQDDKREDAVLMTSRFQRNDLSQSRDGGLAVTWSQPGDSR